MENIAFSKMKRRGNKKKKFEVLNLFFLDILACVLLIEKFYSQNNMGTQLIKVRSISNY